ncbi:MAG: hypothetical protein U5N85_06735 [Arcicella sp.]|nr:hypothetical protein [Arcicella sp.]
MNKNKLIISIIILIFTSCKSTKPIATNKVLKDEKTVTLQVKSLEAINLEEDLTFADEVVLTYSLTAVDENSKVIQVANGSWGVESMKKGQIALKERFKPIELIVPSKSKVLSSVILTEIEDYKKAQNTVLKINSFGGLSKIPALFLTLGEYETPLAVVFASLQAAGIGLQAAERFDKDDLLGQSTFEIKMDTISKPKNIIPIDLNFEGEHLKNTFQYKMKYELIIVNKR